MFKCLKKIKTNIDVQKILILGYFLWHILEASTFLKNFTKKISHYSIK